MATYTGTNRNSAPLSADPPGRHEPQPISLALWIAGVSVFLVATPVVASVWLYVFGPDFSLVDTYRPIQSIEMFDRSDHLMATVPSAEDRKVVPLKRISENVVNALLAAEDHNFFEHHGINVMSIGRAFLTNAMAGHVVEGGSTITQQLVKNLYFPNQPRTLDRKLREAIIACQLEEHCSKQRILELYLNQVYFGNGAYGIERAARKYFNKDASSLSISEAAFLTGLVKAPSEMGLPAHRKQALEREHEVIANMVLYGLITKQAGSDAEKKPLVFHGEPDVYQQYPYYVSYVNDLLHRSFDKNKLERSGIQVFTAMDTQAQKAAEQTLNADIKKAPAGVSQGALVSISVKDGSVLALVGGTGDYWKHQFNRATSAHTAGSSFKPFVYLTGLLQGNLTPDTVLQDEPIVVKTLGAPDYMPKNFDNQFMGPISVDRALYLSRNVCAIRVGQLVGIDNVVHIARLAGINSKLDPVPSLALGSSAVTPLEMAAAYGTFARSGVYIQPWLVRKITDVQGRVVYQYSPQAKKVFPDEPVAELVGMLQDVVARGTGTQARLPNRPVAGKTGTADQARDIWFVGFTPDMVTAVWGGNDADKAIPGSYVTGGTIMANMWRQYNLAYYASHDVAPGNFRNPQIPFEDFDPGTVGEGEFGNIIRHWQTRYWGHRPAEPPQGLPPPHHTGLLGKVFRFFSHF